MPELPDVEVFRQYLNATALHQRIDHVHTESPSLLQGSTPQSLGRSLNGARFEATRRHGKFLFIDLTDKGWLVLHFGMTGKLKYYRDQQAPPDYTQLLITFHNRYHLAYIAPRKLGRITLTDSVENFIHDQELGPDALDLTTEDLLERAEGRRGSMKSWLMNQSILAGVGNIYSDEILFQAGVHPRQPVKAMSREALQDLHAALRRVLKSAIKAGAEPDRMPADFLLPHRKEGGHCPKCEAELKQLKISGRSAWYCPACQASPDQ